MKSYQFNDSPVGLPDSEIFSGRKFSLTGFAKTLEIDKSKLGRAKKAAIGLIGPISQICPSSVALSQMINLYSTPEFRLHTLQKLVKSRKKGWHDGYLYSWDKAILEKYHPEFFEFPAPLPLTANKLEGQTSTYSSSLVQPQGIYFANDATDVGKQKRGEELNAFIAKISCKTPALIDRLNLDIAAWDSLDEEKQHLIAMVVWSLGSLFSTDILNETLRDDPQRFLHYYQKVISKQDPAIYTEIEVDTFDEKAEAIDASVSDLELQAMPFGAMCDQLIALAIELKGDPKNESLSNQVKAIAEALKTKQQFNEVLTTEERVEFLKRIFQFFYLLYPPSPIARHFSEEDGVKLATDWMVWSVCDGMELSAEAVVATLNDVLDAVSTDLREASKLEDNLVDLAERLEVLLQKPEPSNIRDKSGHKNTIASATKEKVSLEMQIGDLALDIYERCLPDIGELIEKEMALLVTDYPQERGREIIALLPEFTSDERGEVSGEEDGSASAENCAVSDVETTLNAVTLDLPPDCDVEEEKACAAQDEAVEVAPEVAIADKDATLSYSPEPASSPEPKPEPTPEPKPILEVVTEQVEQVTTSAHTEIGQKCLDALEQDAFIPGEKINDLFNESLKLQQVNYAAQLAYSLEETQLSADFLPWQLFKAAYYGVNTFDDRYAFSKAQRLLNGISPGDVDAWSHLRHAEAVPYLVLAAAFQPTVFGGMECTGHLLLDSLPGNLLDKNTAGLVAETSAMARRGEKMTLSLLRQVNSDSAKEAPVFDPTQVHDWKKKILTATRGYAPIRKAQAVSLESGLFRRVTEALCSNKNDDYAFMESFVSQYVTLEETSRLLTELIELTGMHQTEDITRVGLSSFHQKVISLVALAREWLSCNRPVHSDKAEDYSRRFVTRLQTSITFFDEGSKSAGSPGAKAGMAYLAATLTRLLKATRGEASKQPHGMVKGWYYHPRQKMRFEAGIDGDKTSEAVRWLIGNAGTQMESYQAYEAALANGSVHMAEVIRHRLNLLGVKIEPSATKQAFEAQRKEFISRCIDLESKVETAGHSGLLDDKSPHWYLSRLEDVREEVESLDGIYNIDNFEVEADEIEAELRFKTANLKEELQNRYINGIETLRNSVPDAVPNSWVENIDRALQEDNLPVVQEMLEDLDRHVERGERMRSPEVKFLPILPAFVARQMNIYKFIIGKSLRRDVLAEVNSGGSGMGLKITSGSLLKKPLQVMEDLQNKKPPAKLSQAAYDQTASILAVAGISMAEPIFSARKDYRYSTGIGTSFAQFYLKAPESRRPFPFFGPRRESKPWTVITVYQSWKVDTLREQLQSQMVPTTNCIMISMIPVSPDQRNEFSRYCKDAQRTIFLLDPVSLVFLASIDNEEMGTSETEKFLWLTAPFTYFNPYVGRTASPPEPEMMFGREHEISSLLDMTSGAAIVYGGRQLGKSTILLAVQRSFHKPSQKHFALYEQLDKELCANKSHESNSLGVAKREVWGRLYKFLLNNGVITTPVIEQTPEEHEKAVHDAILERKDCHIIALFDEIDPILEIDASHSFKIFRALRSLMRHPEVQGRFKMIIGGLANTKRFEENPNYPLSQIGSSIQVTIMPSREATHLVTEPIQAAGYQFESPDVVNAILASTNRHPGLIQILCNQLLTTVGRNANSPVGDTFITKENVRSALNVPEVLETIRERYEMTLNLDKRYLVMVYSILSEGAGSQSFSIKEAKKLATSWAPEAFGSDSDGQFKHFLNELVGLGVLRELDSGRFELRNSSVRKLLSETNMLDVDNKLLQVVEDMSQMDPMDYRPFDAGDRSAMPRPMTYRDQKAITGMVSSKDSNKMGSIKEELFTSTLIIGSEALGLPEIVPTLPKLFDMEHSFFGAPANLNEYTCHKVRTSKYKSPAEFEKNILAVFSKADKLPQMIFVDIDPETDIALLLGLLDATNAIGLNAKKTKYPVRVLFLMGPKAYWQWLQAREFTAGREEAQPIIHLSRWKRCAINLLLEQLEMVDSANAVYEIETATGGWHFAIVNMIRLKREKKNVTKLRDLGPNFPLCNAKSRNARIFMGKAGALDMSWVMPVLGALGQIQEDVEQDDFMLILMEQEGLSDVSEVEGVVYLKWLRDMSLLTTKSKTDDNGKRVLLYSLAPDLKHMVEVLSGEESTVD
jgi:hypothetical protein